MTPSFAHRHASYQDGVDALFAHHENLPPGEKKRQVGAQVPYGRMGTAQDLVGMAIFLASAESESVVAQTYNVDGGNWMSRSEEQKSELQSLMRISYAGL